MAVLRATGADTVILQFTGDRTGAYDERAQARLGGTVPVRVLRRGRAGRHAGLPRAARRPALAQREAAHRLPPPLRRRPRRPGAWASVPHLAACAGWYLPGEIDDETWQSPARTRALADHLAGRRPPCARWPRASGGGGPFFTGRLDPEAHARWWGELMAGRPFDVLALQDGVGTGRVTPARAAAYLRALAPVAAAAGVRLWTVVELFRQLHGAPHDDRPFSAESASFATVRQSLTAERPRWSGPSASPCWTT